MGGVVSVGYADAHPRLNPVGILPPGSRPSDAYQTQPYTAAGHNQFQILSLWRGKEQSRPHQAEYKPFHNKLFSQMSINF